MRAWSGGETHIRSAAGLESTALAHLRRSLIGEVIAGICQGQHRWTEARRAAGRHAGLTDPARDDEQRAAGVLHGFLLLRVEPSKQLLAVIRGVAPVRGSPPLLQDVGSLTCGSGVLTSPVLCLRKFCLPGCGWLAPAGRRLRGDIFALPGWTWPRSWRDQLFVLPGGASSGVGPHQAQGRTQGQLRLRQQFLCLFCLRSAHRWLAARQRGWLPGPPDGIAPGSWEKAVLLIRSVHRLQAIRYPRHGCATYNQAMIAKMAQREPASGMSRSSGSGLPVRMPSGTDDPLSDEGWKYRREINQMDRTIIDAIHRQLRRLEGHQQDSLGSASRLVYTAVAIVPVP